MMKRLIALLVICLSAKFSMAQMKDGFASEDFKGLIKNGLTYITGLDSLLDEHLVQSLKDNWKATEYRVLELEEAKGNLKEDDVLMMSVNVTNSYGTAVISKALILIRVEHLNKLDKKMALAWIDGFTGEHADSMLVTFVPHVVLWLNDMVKQVKDKEITSENLITLNNTINEGISGESPNLKDKPLLIVGKNNAWIDSTFLNNLNVKNKFVTYAEYEKLKADGELNNYYVTYFYHDTDDSWNRFWVYDPEQNKILYACRVNKPNPLKGIFKGLVKQGAL